MIHQYAWRKIKAKTALLSSNRIFIKKNNSNIVCSASVENNHYEYISITFNILQSANCTIQKKYFFLINWNQL